MSKGYPLTVSWLVSAFNAAGTLERCLSSIASQSLCEFEAVIVDDGSSDNSAKIVQSFAAKDPRFRLISLPQNRGLTHALNIGLAQCKGRYIARLDADDEALPDRLAMQLPMIEQWGPRPVLLGSFACWHRDGQSAEARVPTAHAEIVGRLSRHNCFIHSTMLFTNTPALRYDERFRLGQDYALALTALRIGAYLTNIDAVTVVRHDDATTLSRMRAFEQAQYAASARALHRDPTCGEVFESLFNSNSTKRDATDIMLRSEVARHLAFREHKMARTAAADHIRKFGLSPFMIAMWARSFLPPLL